MATAGDGCPVGRLAALDFPTPLSAPGEINSPFAYRQRSAVTEYLLRRTMDGDRWDLLAQEYYGNAFAIEPLLEANPVNASLTILPAGLTLKIPLLRTQDIKPEPEGDVPWR